MAIRILISVCLAAVLAGLSALPAGQRLEREIGLGLLYAIRGDLDAPSEAIVVALDSDSIAWLQRNVRALDSVSEGLDGCLTPHASATLEQSRNVNVVPRALYICLLKKLAPHMPRFTVFDINFNADKPDDLSFAQAIAAAGNVLLLERVTIEGVVRRLKPANILGDAARGIVAFQTDGAGDRVATGYATNLSHAPGAIAMPFQVWRLYTNAENADTTRWPSLQPVWYYGPPKTVSTVSLRNVFERSAASSLPSDLSDTVVFVGVSDAEHPTAYDHFRMPSLSATPPMIGGVEIAATAFLNILHDEKLYALSTTGVALTVFLTVLVGHAVAVFLAGRPGFLAAMAVSAGYLVIAAIGFSSFQLWMPVAIPLVVGTPMSVSVAAILRYASIKTILRRLAPAPVADQFLRRLAIDRGQSRTEQSTIMFIDLENSVRLGESLGLPTFQQVMNRYYDASARAIEAHGGMIIEFKGDGILALFNESVAGTSHARKACQAALDVSRDVEGENLDELTEPGRRLKLRFGLHSGTVVTGVVGSQGRYNYNAMGDSVHVAARLEEYGKCFSEDTRDVIIISGETRKLANSIPGRTELVTRKRLRGREAETEILRLFPTN